MATTALTRKRHGGSSVERGGTALVLLAGAFVALVCVAAVAPETFPGGDPAAIRLGVGLVGPNGHHLFGTDQLGRDILARTVAGARDGVLGPAGVAAGAALVGGSVGLVSGFYGGVADTALMRLIDGLAGLPGLLVTIVVGGVLGGGYILAVALLAVLFCPNDARLVRSATLTLRNQPFMEAARLLGTPARGMMLRHIAPNVAGLEVANMLLNFAFALVALASLSFLGIGVPPGSPNWGRMLSDGLNILGENPAAALAPGLAIALTALSVNILGDWIFDRAPRL